MKKFRVWFCIAVYILAIGSAQGAVLCVGTGGHAHIEMEASGASSCHQGPGVDPRPFAFHSSMTPNFSCDIEQCAPWEHIHLFNGTPEHLALSAQSDFSVDLTFLPSPDAVPVLPGVLDKTGALIAIPTGSTALAFLRSVILLI